MSKVQDNQQRGFFSRRIFAFFTISTLFKLTTPRLKVVPPPP